MARYRFYTADVFTSQRFGGNPLAVLPDARGLDAAAMRAITREFNLSETVFVFPPEDPAHTRRVRIFTPGAELPFAGHPTVGTGFILAAVGEIPLTGETTRIVLEEGVGPVPVAIRSQDGRPVFSQLSAARMPEYGPPPPPPEDVAAVYGLTPEDLLGGDFGMEAVSCGVPFLFVALRGRDALARIRLDRQRYDQVLAPFWAREAYLFCFEPERAGSDLRARMFAPFMGIVEDPATGAAATALAGYLARHAPSSQPTQRWVVEQGFEMGRPSILEVEMDQAGGQIQAVRVGGASVLVSEGWIEY
jgi:trans-2,3-dihydro-3-hydroxyanthranilate isomerase